MRVVLLLALPWLTTVAELVGDITKEDHMNGRKPHGRQSLVSWFKSCLRRRGVLTWAFRLVSLVNLVARIHDWMK